ncbi:MAG: Beta-galactosidase BgaA [Lentisphaerae bacterium ADurb.BinA184]|nr:MAG: Beta-galactosidase BgaA [Lentisphaerae bacterium ADurb.BinA184]
MYVGADYYPEHWPQARWKTDAKLMREAGFNLVRLAEFAWVFLEPEEGRFTFDWLDEALDILGRNGISAVLGTPTAVMPAWVKEKYPEVMATRKEGHRVNWGIRKNNCFSSGAYRLLSERITRAMAEHFRQTANVVGWQTDNEFGHPYCYCDSCRREFQAWLRRRYGTLDELNRAWGTHFWGHRYGEWAEIVLPDDEGGHNPGLCLDWHRFYSWLNVRFQAAQVRILREVCPQHFVTHNFMGTFSELDYYDLAADLDFVSWDNYPVWGAPAVPYGASLAADAMRGLKKRNFLIMEQTAGPGGWGTFGRNPRPGELRKVCYQQLAHGADGQVWFRWRTCTAGREQYWHGLLGHDGRPLRRYREAAQVAGEYHRLAAAVEGTTVKADVAMIYDYESIWALRIQPGYGPVGGSNFHAAAQRYYDACFRAGVNLDMIRPTDDFTAYSVVIAPHLYVLPDPVARALADFVAKGGVLLTDCRTGVKDGTNLCHDRTLPGLLGDALGISIEEYEAIPGDDKDGYAVIGQDDLPGAFTARHYCDWITPRKAEVLAGYERWHMKPYAAVTRNRFGKGTGYYVGTLCEEPAFYDALIADVLKRAAVKPVVAPPAGVEASVRQARGRRLLFLINHTEETKTVTVPAGGVELLTGRPSRGSLTLERYGVAVIKLK